MSVKKPKKGTYKARLSLSNTEKWQTPEEVKKFIEIVFKSSSPDSRMMFAFEVWYEKDGEQQGQGGAL